MPAGDRAVAVRLFGRHEIAVDGEPFRLATPRKTLQTLAYLLLNRGGAVSREYLAFLQWPDDEEEAARAKLRTTISDLLKVLPQPASDFVIVESDSLAWNPAARVWLDVDEFVAAARDRSRTEEAIALYRGDLLVELYDEWLYAIRERHRDTYVRCLVDLMADQRKKGDLERGLETARTVLSIDPWREDVVRRIMAMRYQLGDRAGALNEYVRFGERLRAEMGIEPMAETAALAEQIGDSRDVASEARGLPSGSLHANLLRDNAVPIVGRGPELERLTEAWSRAKQGRGNIVFLGGEPGIGKSRLALELVQAVEEDGGRVLAGATGVPESFPYQVFVEALRAGLPLVAALGLGKSTFATLAPLLPELPQRVGALPPLPTLDPERQRLRLLEAISRALIGLSQPRPLLLVFEDLHWASQATFDALAFVARQTAGSRVLIVGTFRDDEAHRRHPLRRLQREAEFQGVATTISLPPLDLEAVTAIVRSAPGHAMSAELAAAMHARSDGNPLFLSQLLAAPDDVLGGTVPPTIASLVETRIAALSERGRTVAEVAALIGERFAVEIVRDVTGWDDATALAAVDELLDRRIIRETTGRGIFRYAFAHQLVQQAILHSYPESGKRDRSRRIARVLGELYPERAEELAADIARQLDRGGDPQGAAEQYLIAARRALELGATDEAMQNATAGVRQAPKVATHCDLLLTREAANLRGGDIAASSSDLDALTALAGDDVELRCKIALRRILLASMVSSPELSSLLIEVRELAARTGNLNLIAEADFVSNYLLDQNLNVEDAIAAVRRSVANFTRAGNEAGRATALAALARALSLAGEHDEARRLAFESIDAATASGDYSALVRSLRFGTGVMIEADDRDSATELSRRWFELSISAADRREEASALAQCAWPLAEGLTFMRGLEPLERAAVIGRELNSPRIRAMLDVNAATIWLKLGAFTRARELLEAAVAFHATKSAVFMSGAETDLALALAHDGEPERAAELARKAMRAVELMGRKNRTASSLESLAEADWRCGRRQSACDQFEAALHLRRATGARVSIVKDTSLLAALRAEMGDPGGARVWAAQVPLDASTVGGGFWPQRSAWAVAFAYHTCGEPALAATWLRCGVAQYEESMAHLDDEQRHTFAALSWHKAMLAAHRDAWPASFW